MLRNLEEQVLYLSKVVEQIQQVLGNALPDPIPGPQGDPGEQGTQGEPGPQGFGIVGYGTQLPASGRDGDWFLLKKSTMTGIDFVMCRCVSQHWVEQFSIRGPAGPIANATEVIANPVENASDVLEKINVDGVIYQVSTVEKYNGVDNPYTFTGLEAITINGTNYFVGGSWAKFLSGTLYFDDDNNKVVCEEDIQFNKDIYLTNGNVINGGTRGAELELSNYYYLSGQLVLDDIHQIVDEDYAPMIVCENLTDANNTKRFVENTIAMENISGVTFSYHKWSLSGSHLMIVIAGTVASGTTLQAEKWCDLNLPNYIKNKIFPVFEAVVERTTISAWNSDYTAIDLNFWLLKYGEGLQINQYETPTTTKSYNFRIQFDLLIDME